MGVDIFFVISGYVITAMLLREWGRSGRISLSRFYWRRFIRLTPALAVMVLCTLLVSAAVLSPFGPQETAARTGIGAMFLAANVAINSVTGNYFDAPADINPLLHTWSLSVEEQFYLAFPLALIGGLVLERCARRRWAAPLTILLIGAGSVALMAFAPEGAGTFADVGGFYSPAARAWEFAVGALVALWLRRGALHGRLPAMALGVGGATAVVASLWLVDSGDAWPGAWTALPVGGTALLLVAGAGRDPGPVAGALSTRWMVRVGDWSYSIYLWHWPCIVFASIAWPGHDWVKGVAAAFSMVPALASFYFLEEPLRRRDWGAGGARLRRVVLTFAVPAVVGVLVLVAAVPLWSQHAAYGAAGLTVSRSAVPPGEKLGCHYPGYGAPGFCHWNRVAPGAPVYLFGDSNAAHFESGLIIATRRQRRPLTAATASSCPLIALDYVRPKGAPKRNCKGYVRAVLHFMKKARPGTVVLAMSDDYWRDRAYGLRLAGGVRRDPKVKLPAVRAGLITVVRTLQQQGHSVVLLQTVPTFTEREWNPARCPLWDVLSGDCERVKKLSVAWEEAREVRTMLRAVGHASGAEVGDVGLAVCPYGDCRTASEEAIVYRDRNHLSNAESERLAPVLMALMASRAGKNAGVGAKLLAGRSGRRFDMSGARSSAGSHPRRVVRPSSDRWALIGRARS